MVVVWRMPGRVWQGCVLQPLTCCSKIAEAEATALDLQNSKRLCLKRGMMDYKPDIVMRSG
jgi:hypothetical protein